MAEPTTTPPNPTDLQGTGAPAPIQGTEWAEKESGYKKSIETLTANGQSMVEQIRVFETDIKTMKAAEAQRLAEIQAEADKELEAKGDWENRLASQEKQHQKMIEEMTGKYDGTAAALRKAIVENSVIQAATEAQAVSPAQIMAIFGNLFAMDDAMAKAVVNIDACKNAGIDPYDGADLKTVKALMADLAKDERNLNLFKPTSTGGAGSAQPTGQPGANKEITEADFNAMSQDEKTKILSDKKFLKEYREKHKT